MNIGRSATVVGVCSLCVILLIIYVGLDTKGSFHFQERPGFMTYGMLAEAFVSGQIYLKQEVDPERLRSPDPLDPSTPYPFMFDLIIWDGKYFFPREPLPGLLRAVILYPSGLTLPTGALVVTFALGVLILLGALLWIMRQRFFPQSPPWMLWYIWLSFALSGTQLYIVSRPVVYHEGFAEGCFFILAGSILLVHGLSGARHGLMALCLAGICFGAAIACRALLVLYPTCYFVIFITFSAIRRESVKTTIGWTLSFSVPVVLWVAALLAYNYLRFGTPLDFGYSHIIVPNHSAYLYLTLGGHFFSWKHVPYNLYYYLLSLPRLVSKFPFLYYPIGTSWVNDVYLHREAVCSVFITMPVLLLSLPVSLLFRRLHIKDRLSLILGFFVVSPLMVLAALFAFYGAVARYYYEFTPILFVVAFCNLAAFWDRIATSPRGKTLAKVVLSLFFIGNVLMGLLLGLTGTRQ
jgi:hypothetical protein